MIITSKFNNVRGNCILDKDSLKKAVDEYNERIKNNPSEGLVTFGESNDIRLTDVCGKVNDINYDGELGNISVEVLETPMGKLVQDIMKAEIPISVQPYGYGQMNEVGEITDFSLIGFSVNKDI